MPSFENAWRWERLEPELGGNRQLPEHERFYLLVASGLTKVELQRLYESLGETTKAQAVVVTVEGTPPETLEQRQDRYAAEIGALLGPVVKLGKEPLKVDGKPVASITDYLVLAVRQVGQPLLTELLTAIRTANSWEGSRALFSERHSGGFTFTGDPSAEATEGQTAAR